MCEVRAQYTHTVTFVDIISTLLRNKSFLKLFAIELKQQKKEMP